jgi:hypothetical protein
MGCSCGNYELTGGSVCSPTASAAARSVLEAMISRNTAVFTIDINDSSLDDDDDPDNGK